MTELVTLADAEGGAVFVVTVLWQLIGRSPVKKTVTVAAMFDIPMPEDLAGIAPGGCRIETKPGGI
jgi:hypothetical protein